MFLIKKLSVFFDKKNLKESRMLCKKTKNEKKDLC